MSNFEDLFGGLYWKLKGDYAKTIEYYDKEIELNSGDVYAYLQKGDTLLKLDKYEEAITCFDKLLALSSDFGYAYYEKGTALYELGKYEEAISCFDKAIELDTDDPEAYLFRGNIYFLSLNENITVKGWNIHKNSAYTDFNSYLYLTIYYKEGHISYSGGVIKSGNIMGGKIENLSTLIKFFQLYPQTILTIFEYSDSNIDSFLSLYGIIKEAQRSIEDFTILLNYYKLHIVEEYEFLGIKAILFYYLGGSVAAYKIFDEELSKDDCELSSQELYYFALTAVEINRKADTIIQNGIDNIENQKAKDKTDYYYLGHLYLMKNDEKNAKKCFKKSSNDFSKLMLTYLTQKDIPDLNNIDNQYISDIDYTKEDLSQFQDYFHYRECIDTIRNITIAKHSENDNDIFDSISQESFINKPLWEVFKLSKVVNDDKNNESDKQKIEKAIRKKESDIIKKEILEKSITNIGIKEKDLLKEILEDDNRLEQYKTTKERFDFAEQKAKENSIESFNIEKLLGSRIKNMGTNAQDCMYFIYYYYLKIDERKISSEQAFDLMLYLRHTIDEAKFKQTMKEIANLGVMTIPGLEAVVKGFNTGVLAYQSIYKDCLEGNDTSQSSDYENFKRNLWQIIPSIGNKFLDEMERLQKTKS